MNGHKKICRASDQGFSLLEVIVVLAIAASVMALVLPNIWRKPPDIALRTTAIEMASMLRAVRAVAVRQNGDGTFLIDTVARTYWSDMYPTPRVIPASISVNAELPARARLTATTGRYRFHPDGTASGGSITLIEGDKTATIAIDSQTGNAEVRWNR